MSHLYLDCFAGISGDMTVGTLLDLGVELAALRRELDKLGLDGYAVRAEKVDKRGLQATQFAVVLTEESQGHRHLRDILALITGSALTERVKTQACHIFQRLGQAEAEVHGIPVEAVHFHEVGAVDSIVDVVGAVISLELLGVETVTASALPTGSGFVRMAHGRYPLPAPATANLLRGVPSYGAGVPGELVTPTGAAIVTTLAASFGPRPPLAVEAVGYGAGTREAEYPNVLRGFLAGGEGPRPVRTPFAQQHQAPVGPHGYHEAPAVVIEANIDDMNPQFYENLLAHLLDAGALDVLFIPAQMKKNRPGTLLHVLAHPEAVEALVALIFTESSTIGLRTYAVTKRMLQREVQTVATPYGPIRVKVARLGERVVNAAPEYEDCRAAARRHQEPVHRVYAVAQASALGEV